MKRCIGCFSCMKVCSAVNHKNFSLTKSAIKVRTSGGISGRFVSLVCIACKDERACATVCMSEALEKRPGGGVIFKPEKCIGCGKCVDVCAIGGVQWDKDENKPIICKHCGLCAKFCPHKCLTMEDVSDDL
ncbi:MAG: 4Fe-4S binding protein [Oscillospiraceae bacterium]|nr:4Fe-4S binding protein [Oscillospiraceae bacterium]